MNDVIYFPYERHGVGLSQDDPHTGQWMPLLIKWLDQYGYSDKA